MSGEGSPARKSERPSVEALIARASAEAARDPASAAEQERELDALAGGRMPALDQVMARARRLAAGPDGAEVTPGAWDEALDALARSQGDAAGAAASLGDALGALNALGTPDDGATVAAETGVGAAAAPELEPEAQIEVAEPEAQLEVAEPELVLDAEPEAQLEVEPELEPEAQIEVAEPEAQLEVAEPERMLDAEPEAAEAAPPAEAERAAEAEIAAEAAELEEPAFEAVLDTSTDIEEPALEAVMEAHAEVAEVAEVAEPAFEAVLETSTSTELLAIAEEPAPAPQIVQSAAAAPAQPAELPESLDMEEPAFEAVLETATDIEEPVLEDVVDSAGRREIPLRSLADGEHRDWNAGSDEHTRAGPDAGHERDEVADTRLQAEAEAEWEAEGFEVDLDGEFSFDESQVDPFADMTVGGGLQGALSSEAMDPEQFAELPTGLHARKRLAMAEAAGRTPDPSMGQSSGQVASPYVDDDDDLDDDATHYQDEPSAAVQAIIEDQNGAFFIEAPLEELSLEDDAFDEIATEQPGHSHSRPPPLPPPRPSSPHLPPPPPPEAMAGGTPPYPPPIPSAQGQLPSEPVYPTGSRPDPYAEPGSDDDSGQKRGFFRRIFNKDT